VHHGAHHAGPCAAALSALDPPLGTYAVLGNHDHWDGAPEVREALLARSIPVLENEHRIVTRNGARLCIAGIEELWEGAPDVAAALAGVDAGVPRIVISHNPDLVDALGDEPRVDLVLAGHTHGGQIVLPWLGPLLVPARREHASGLVRTPHAWLYVTRGLGVITPPARLGCRPEIAILELVRAPSPAPRTPPIPRGT
jgi:predicted MPP superfamily phosphohydrolase